MPYGFRYPKETINVSRTDIPEASAYPEFIYWAQDLSLIHIFGFKDARPEELFGGVCKEDAARIFDNILTGHATPAPVSYTHLVEPGGSHRARIGTLPEEEKKQVMELINEWLKQ